MNKQDAIDAIACAAMAYHDALCEWNGDNDGPKEKADEKLYAEIERVLNAFTN